VSITYLLYLAIGRLFIYLGMKFPPLANSRFDFVKQLFSCDLCLGVWIFTGLSFVMGEVLFRDFFYVPVISEVITGGISSFLVHIFVLGWQSKFEVLIIE
jgi:hypothetical protein